jgi:hypothetical protein
MVPLLEGHKWIDRLLPTHEGPETGELPEVDLLVKEYDYFVPIMGLPRRLNVTVESLRWDGPYITWSGRTEPNKQSFVWSRTQNIPWNMKRPLVGICWMGAEKLDPRRHRSLNIEQVTKILKLSDVTWVNLQFGVEAPVPICTPTIKNWKDTAEVIDALDLVVTVDTGVMHLAGAMGKRAICLLPSLSDWKFGLYQNNENRMPFYPSVQLVRNEQFAKEQGLDHAVNWLVSELPHIT